MNIYNSGREIGSPLKGPNQRGLFILICSNRPPGIIHAPVAQWKRSRLVIDRLGVRIPSGAFLKLNTYVRVRARLLAAIRGYDKLEVRGRRDG